MRNALLFAALLALAGCDSGTAPRDAAVSGKWLYRGQVGYCTINAVLRVRQDGSTVTGTVPPLATGCYSPFGIFSFPADSSVTVSGQVKGDSITFTLRAWGFQLVHTAAVMGDSMSGTVTGADWLPAHSGADGTFGARRYTTEVLPDRFRLVLSGAVSDTLEGSASGTQFGVLFSNDDGTGAGGVTKNLNVGGFPLVPGTYRIYDRTVQRDSLAGGVTYRGAFYRFRDGIATIGSVTGDTFQGTFDVTAYLSTDPNQTVQVRGGFYPHYYIQQ